MAGRYGYQYETSPRKLKPEYNVPTKKVNKKKTVQKKQPSKNIKQKKQDNPKENKTEKVKINETKKEKILRAKTSFFIFVKCVALFAILFLVVFRNSQMSETFSQIQALKAQITELQKENDQLEINIQNSINANHIEQQAKELLGMQKLSNKQIVYISLQKKDYVEPRTEEIIVEENNGFFENLIEKIKNIF